MDYEKTATDDFNALPLTEREHIGRFMELERIQQLRRDRKNVVLLVGKIDAEIKRCLDMLSRWPIHDPTNRR